MSFRWMRVRSHSSVFCLIYQCATSSEVPLKSSISYLMGKGLFLVSKASFKIGIRKKKTKENILEYFYVKSGQM